ncbi:hypothetical protein NBRC3257_0262 [Gluconobacter thailandicus NBRC 3257]|uniref:Transposase n=1 Tax=Gluconobacter thailandicus NBRC 3257 TaxID=1381097 RepID=A0ABQ0IUU0_GLUTH|nr:hypothetical protein NBRC3255_2670 [Gluconobacter thailandicus NBRC 3255]GAD25263.1 hypothetical protein NBRC3257_0262 [Gluconobacter thailandicus NBRC 3257]
MSVSCEDLTMTSHGPRNISMPRDTVFRLPYQAEYRIHASFPNEELLRAPTFQAKA